MGNIEKFDYIASQYDTTERIKIAKIIADYIIVAQTLLHIRDIESILENFFAILNQGGHLVIVDFDKNADIISNEVHNGFEQEALVKMIDRIGFTNIQAKTFYHGENIFMGKDASLFYI